VVDDYEPWRRFVRSALQEQSELQVIAEVSDGAVAVQKALELQPDLILLDLGLAGLNGIDAARQIRECVPKAKILFVTENSSWDIAEEGLRTPQAYVMKEDAGSELLIAVSTVLPDEKFVSRRFAGRDFSGT
jgi:DNA-binding NarL/FixJ family response regulator